MSNRTKHPKTIAQAEASEGGWTDRKDWLTQDEADAAEKRWAMRSYLPRYDDNYQCGGCRFFAAFGADYGVCCNVASAMDGNITFEHGGCEQHSVKVTHTSSPGKAK